MNTPLEPNHSVPQPNPPPRLRLWLRRPSRIGRIFFAFFLIALVAVLFYAEESWRGRRAWEKYKAEMSARGVRLDWEPYIPPQVPNEQNFAMTPLLAPLFGFLPGTQTYRDSNAVQKIEARFTEAFERASDLGFSLGARRRGRWELGETIDLIALLGTNRLRGADNQGIAKLTQLKLSSNTIASSVGPAAAAPSGTNPIPAVVWPTMQAEAAAILAGLFSQTFDSVATELRAASRRPFSRFNIRYDLSPPGDARLPHHALLRRAVQQLTWRASAELTLGQNGEAFEDLLLALYTSDAVHYEPFAASHLLRLSCRWILTQALWEGITKHCWTADQLAILQGGLAKDDFARDAEWTLRAQRAASLSLAGHLRSGAGDVSWHALVGNSRTLSWALFLCPGGWFFLEQLNLGRGFDRCLEPLADWRNDHTTTPALFAAWKGSDGAFRGQTAWSLFWRHRLLESAKTADLGDEVLQSWEAQTRGELSLVACALERYSLARNTYPESLNDLVPQYLVKLPLDVMSGKPLIYRRGTPRTFLLYSVGRNLVDDGGKVALGNDGQVKLEEGDLVWRQP